ncbi:MAG: rhomboid family intramembrane serine protease, partial [Chitinophagaceae bacterium]
MSEFRFTRPDNFPPIVKNLIIINVLVYVAQMLLDSKYAITEKLMLWPLMPQQLHEWLVNQGALSEANKFQPYQIVTHMFSHSPGSLFHIIFNMFALWMFGKILENVWGPKRFLIFYLACGVGAAALHLGIQYFRCEQLWDAVSTNNIAAINKL